MKAFRRIIGRAAVLDRADVDTDQIIPKQFLKRIERTGYGEFLFFDWIKEPDFELRRPEAAGAQILLAGRNFGCGSSREHAAWALQDYGFDVVIAPSFGDIFRTNALKIGLVPIVLDPEEVRRLMRDGAGGPLTVDLGAQEITAPDGRIIAFEFEPFARDCLLQGLDEIALTLQREDAIAAYEGSHLAAVDTLALQVQAAAGYEPKTRRRRTRVRTSASATKT
jgi:3-isopropylmalate/(R)-2-methylmalate dehydratase small subunit